MSHGTIHIKDEVNVRVKGVDRDTLKEASKELTFFVPGFQFMPAYKLGRWPGTIKLFHETGATYLNLLDRVLPTLENAGYEFSIQDDRRDWSDVLEAIECPDDHVFAEYKNDKGEPIILRDYQMDAIRTALSTGSGILEMATGAGKTLTCAAISHAYAPFGKVVVIVPDVGLVLQTHGVFKSVGIDTGIWYEKIKEQKQVTISTWQSLDGFPELMNDVVCVILDEAHQGKAKTINEIMTGPAKNVPFRFGCTGTLPKEELFRLQIEASIGPSIFQLATWELQKKKVLAETNIYQIQLQDKKNPAYWNHKRPKNVKDEDWKGPDFPEWKNQLDWFFTCEDRMRIIAELIQDAVDTSGNTLVLVNYRAHGEALQALLPGSVYMDGTNDAKTERLPHFKRFNETDGNILICTAGIASKGIDIPRIFNLIFIELGKRFERTMQTIGRGLRKASDKDSVNILDICGDHGYSKSHATDRRSLYREAKQHVEIITLEYC